MKKLNLLFAVPGVLAMQTAIAQSTSHLTLSDPYPKPGEKLTLTYNPEGTPLAGEKGLSATVYFIDNKDFPTDDIALKPVGKSLQGQLTIPATAKSFMIRIGKDDLVDNNSDKGYIYLVHNGKKPVPGAYASKAYILSTGMGSALANIKRDIDGSIDLYKKDITENPGIDKEYQSNYYMLLAGKKDPASAALLNEKLNSLSKSTEEKDLMLAKDIYYATKRNAQADSLLALTKAKYPNGESVKNIKFMSFIQEQDPDKKEAIYKDYIQYYPENASDKRSPHDNMRIQLAAAYLKADKMEAFSRLAAQVKDKARLAGSLNGKAYELAKSGQKLDEAAALSKQSLDYVSAQINNPPAMPYYSKASLKKNYKSAYDSYADTYALILYKQGKHKEALSFEQPVYEQATEPDAEISYNYATILKANGQDAKAKQVLEKAVQKGKSSGEIDTALKEMYAKTKGSDSGFDTYYASLKSASDAALKAKLVKEMINQPAPAFTLKDFDGNAVSLASLKGKVVVVDFWATWCGPCKASFPGMQLAVNKYKDNPNVKFLFIDTWEHGDNYIDGAKKFIADNKYTFHVLIDEKNEDNRQAKVVTTFNVDGIPTKFVIDGNGNIRFKHVGYSGSTSGVLDEVSAMVDLALNPDAAVAGAQKVTKNE
ncbi:redoxin domain-containing protein [Mucilaginibacter sp. Bleaf8]|uniref:redoxin domain-containing protein n=1 Tax=Mucilaginibacter sp. Bleaf8 TaxID=2834430 RepID=UPI001BCADC20|nr:redoxin domain-containing protein [Mucilaginibacter sp. Bleaf8]MBS7562869.1 redoxin domain-containing protein [Mucilaginibacter sp. Bleaf8]